MSTEIRCDHDLAERETACADGMCPLCAADELARLRATQDKLLKSNVQYMHDLQKAQKVLCPDFGDCADKLAEGEKCACGFEDGPYGNAVPPNREAARLRRLLASALYALDGIVQRTEIPIELPDYHVARGCTTVGDLHRAAEVAERIHAELKP